jgi:hypothetical protein
MARIVLRRRRDREGLATVDLWPLIR